MTARVGIEKLTAYTCQLSLSMEALALARGADPAHPRDELLVAERSVNPLWEDPVTMAANAARQLLKDEDPEQIELCIVGSESSVDFGKPMSTWVYRFAGLSPNCRNFEVKHACYGGTGGIMMAAHWIASGLNRGRKALVVCADQSREHIGKPWEYVLGAAATAMLISDQPQVLELELATNGFWTQEISDTYRPTSRDEVGHADTSLYGYLDGLEGAYASYCKQAGNVDYEADFARNIYHVPFGGMTFYGHKQIMRGIRRMSAREAREHWEKRTKPSLTYNGRFGGSYTSATMIALAGLIDSDRDVGAGDRISIYSYGSGSCAEFYAARIGEEARQRVAAQQIGARLDAREALDISTYESLERQRMANVDQRDLEIAKTGLNGLYERRYAGSGLVVLDGVDGWERRYRVA